MSKSIPNFSDRLQNDPTTQTPSIPSPSPSKAPSEVTLPLPSGREVSGNELANAFGVGAFNKK